MSRPPVTARRRSGHRRAPMRCWSSAAAPAARRRSVPTRITRWSSPTTSAGRRRLVLGAGRSAGDYLERGGLPRCAGDVMATNPAWRVPLRAWQEQFAAGSSSRRKTRCSRRRSSSTSGRSTATWTSRNGCGGDPAGRGSRQFLGRLAAVALRRRSPAGFPGLCEASTRPDRLKAYGIAPIVDLARLFALEAGSHATATVDGLRAAAEHGTARKATAADPPRRSRTSSRSASAIRSAAWRLVGRRTMSSPLPSSPCSSAADQGRPGSGPHLPGERPHRLSGRSHRLSVRRLRRAPGAWLASVPVPPGTA